MEEVVRFALLGFGVGALYALGSHGLIVIYRGSGVLNFGLGATGMTAAYVQWELATNRGWPFLASLVVGVLVAAMLGALTHLLLMRPLRQRSPLVRVIATLGVLATLQGIAILRYGPAPKVVPSELPTDRWVLWGDVAVTADRVILLGIAAASTAGLWLLYRYSRFGIRSSAVAENERAASSLGVSPDVVATVSWALGSGLAGLAAILIAPIVTLQPSVMTNLILAAMAAALLASFRSFPLALAAGLVIGVAQTEVNRFVDQPGFGAAVPFILIVGWLLVRGQALPLRDYLLQKLPSIGNGRIRWGGVAAGVGLAALLMGTTPPVWIDAFTVTACAAFVLLSIVVLTGYAGQLSLAQFAIAGFGAWVAGRLVAAAGLPFWLGLVVGVAATVPLGVLFALPAVRARGINLAIVTLGLGTVIELMLFQNSDYTGGSSGTIVSVPHLFGMNISAAEHPMRYGMVVVVCLTLATLAVANVRRGRSGRRLIAVRTNERAAAALGISVAGVKLYAFALSAALAALGGILLAFRSSAISYASFTTFTSIADVGYALIGGIGYLIGPVFGATLAPGAVGSQVLNEIGPGVAEYIPLIGGLGIILLVLLNPDGIASDAIRGGRKLGARLSDRFPALRPRVDARLGLTEGQLRKVVPKTLEVRDLTVRYGGTTAVHEVSLAVRPSEIVGLIGPNGAGKTTLIDAVTGFVRIHAGSVLLDRKDIGGWSPARRSRAGIARSFQSLELFEDSTVLDNLRCASDPRDVLSYVRDPLYPVTPPLTGEVASAIREFQLAADLQTPVQELPYGERRLLAIARAVASRPSVLLLDEPAAGLGDVETAELAHLVRRLADDWGMAVLLVEHDMTFVMSVCDELIVLDFGHTISTGTPARVRQDPAVVAAYLGDDHEEAVYGPARPSGGAVVSEALS